MPRFRVVGAVFRRFTGHQDQVVLKLAPELNRYRRSDQGGSFVPEVLPHGETQGEVAERTP